MESVRGRRGEGGNSGLCTPRGPQKQAGPIRGDALTCRSPPALWGQRAAFRAVPGSTGQDSDGAGGLRRAQEPASALLGEALREITRLQAAFLGGQDNGRREGGKMGCAVRSPVKLRGDKPPPSELLPLFPGPWLSPRASISCPAPSNGLFRASSSLHSPFLQLSPYPYLFSLIII